RAGVDQVVLLAAAPGRPAAPVGARGGDRAARQLERQRALRGLDADRPGAAARVDQAGARGGEQLAGPVDGVTLADPAEVEADALAELDLACARVDAH